MAAINDLIAQIPYNFLWHGLNILFTFACSLFLLWLWDCAKKLARIEKFIMRIIVVSVLVLLSCIAYLTKLDYRWYGILLPFVFYVLRNGRVLKFLFFVVMTILFVVERIGKAYHVLVFNNFI